MLEFDRAFKTLTDHAPFPWQRALFERFSAGELPPAVDIPTGLGKTAVMVIWLLARAAGASLPRRLVYVVDRRAVVDQATDFAETLRTQLNHADLEHVRRALKLSGRSLPISTLRGQHVDNREWMDDPATPAIIVGTVDMVGSRLLFEGYGVSRRMRPYQAGLMGCDSLVLLDEAHLSRPFERLLRTIETERRARAEKDADAGQFAGPPATAGIPPDFRVLPLSATLASAESTGAPFTLLPQDRVDERVRARLDASKTLTVEDLDKHASIEDVLLERAWNLAWQEAAAVGRAVRVLVYCDRRKVAESVAADLRQRDKLMKSGAAVILFVGGRRVHERETAAEELRRHGLLGGGGGASNGPVFVVATSAGEVGVDLDADHMVCDLVAWERMVQRLGRVNRRGSGAARVLVIDQGPPEKGSAKDVARHLAVKTLLKGLPPGGSGHQAGPEALTGAGRSSEGRDRIADASTPMLLYPALTRPLIDAWSMTSLAEHSGRPEVEPWLRGWVKPDPQTTVVWRCCLPVRVDETVGSGARTDRLAVKAVEEFFEAASPHTAERLETETSRVVEWLRKRARSVMRSLEAAPHGEPDPEVDHGSEVSETDDGAEPRGAAGAERAAPLRPQAPVAFVLDSGSKPDDGGGRSDCILSLREAAGGLTVKELERRLAGRLLVVDARICGLRDGLLDAANGKRVPTAEDNWGEQHAWDQAVRDDAGTEGLPAVRARLLSDDERDRLAAEREAARANDGQGADAWRESWAAQYRVSATARPVTWLVVEKWRAAAPDEDSHAMAPLQRLEQHQEMAAQEADRIAVDLGLPDEDRAMLVAAARHHDDGKRARRWQRAFNAPPKGGPYAKTPGPLNRHVLNGYRHEFQSMLDAEENGLDGLARSDARFELALHLIAAHHGHARPAIGVDGCDRLPPTAAARRAYEIGQRFARLQRKWGPWELAWWEALLRAADQRASRALDEAVRARKQPGTQTSRITARVRQSGLFPAPVGAAD